MRYKTIQKWRETNSLKRKRLTIDLRLSAASLRSSFVSFVLASHKMMKKKSWTDRLADRAACSLSTVQLILHYTWTINFNLDSKRLWRRTDASNIWVRWQDHLPIQNPPKRNKNYLLKIEQQRGADNCVRNTFTNYPNAFGPSGAFGTR